MFNSANARCAEIVCPSIGLTRIPSTNVSIDLIDEGESTMSVSDTSRSMNVEANSSRRTLEKNRQYILHRERSNVETIDIVLRYLPLTVSTTYVKQHEVEQLCICDHSHRLAAMYCNCYPIFLAATASIYQFAKIKTVPCDQFSDYFVW